MLTICIAENRPTCEPALRILIASLAEHCPGTRSLVFCPTPSASFRGWIARYQNCALNPCPLDGPWTKYDIKPLALLTALRFGAENVVWIDSDILIARDFRPLFSTLSNETIAVTEEALSGTYADPGALRARMWGMPVGRILPFCANTGVVRVTPAHIDLLKTWNELLQSPEYREAQVRHWTERPTHLAGDQEVLTALLSSTRFADLPIKHLRRGPDIIQFFGPSGYTVVERLGHLRRGLPFFVHSQGYRPWWPKGEMPASWTTRFQYNYNLRSPYTTLARSYASELEDDSWLRSTSPFGPSGLARTGRNAPLTGLPLAVVADAVRGAKSLVAKLRG